MSEKLAPMVIEELTKTYEVETTEGRFRLTVPASFKVTFGAIVPGSAKSTGQSYAMGAWGLRFWSAADKQHAVFSGVTSFRDVSLPMEIAAVRKFGSEDWHKDDSDYPPGTVERGWIPVDQVKERPRIQAPQDGDEDVGDNASYMSAVRTRSGYAVRKP